MNNHFFVWYFNSIIGQMSQDNSSNSTDVKNTDPSHVGTDTTTDVKETKSGENKTIPYERFKDVNSKLKEVEQQNKELLSYKLQVEESERKKTEEESLKKWEFEKIIWEKENTIKSLQDQVNSLSEKDQIIKDLAFKQIEEFKSIYWEESYEKARTIIDSEDPIVIMRKLPTMAEFIKEKAWVQKWGSDIQRWSSWANARLEELQNKLKSGKALSYVERTEYLTLAKNSKK